MITQAFQFVGDVLNGFIKKQFGLDESRVIANNLIDSDGSIPQANRNKLVVSLINVERETAQAFNTRSRLLPSGNYADISPVEKFNLDVLVSSNFDDYTETLKFLDSAILFFQKYPFLDASCFSSVPDGLQKVEFNPEKISYQQMQSLWTAMGAKYQPSIIYKLRLITIQANEINGLAPGISQVSNLALA